MYPLWSPKIKARYEQLKQQRASKLMETELITWLKTGQNSKKEMRWRIEWNWEHDIPKPMGCSEGTSKRKANSIKSLH